MTGTEKGDRHLNRQGLEEYLAAGAPATLKIAGNPTVHLVVDPVLSRLSLRTPQAKNKLPDVSAYKNFASDIVHWEAQQWCQLSISGPAIRDAFPVLYAIADRMQIEGADFARATNAALEAFRELLSGIGRLSDEQEVGLFGELLVLEHLLHNLPKGTVLAGWRGTDAEEHDFDIGQVDVEVKTTTSEARQHWITSASQLMPTLNRDLWLVSIQVTGAGAAGRSLGDLVSSISASLRDEPLQQAFGAKLRRAGLDAGSVGHYTRKMRLRSAPAIFRVDANFPTLTPGALATLGLQDRIIQLRYLIDLSNAAPPADAPIPIQNLGVSTLP